MPAHGSVGEDATTGILDDGRLAATKSGAMLVNTAHTGFMTREASINLLAMAFDILEEEMARV